MIIISIISYIVFAYFFVCVLYLLLFSVAGLFRNQPCYSSIENKKRFAVLIPSYKDDQVILSTVHAALDQDYPNDKYDVIVIADKLKEETINQLNLLRVKVMPVAFEKSTKARSIKYALTELDGVGYQIVLILDSDNLLGVGGLNKINHAFDVGYGMVQLHRRAKNRNTSAAILDAISEEVNNHIFRKGHRALGFSAALIGSGMAFNYEDLQFIMNSPYIEDNPGEDREINREMLKKGFVCEYIEDSFVYDEKVQSGDVMEMQRTRWISAQLNYAVKFWLKEPIASISRGMNYFDFAFQTLLMPRILMMVALFAIVIIFAFMEWILGLQIGPGVICWMGLFIGCLMSVSIGILNNFTIREIGIGILGFPDVLTSFSKALLKSSANQQEFIHTPKEFIDNGNRRTLS